MHGFKTIRASRVLQFLSFIEDLSPQHILTAGKKEMEQANAYLRKFSDQSLTLTDAVGLVFMDQQHVNICWSNDHHLTLTGKHLVIYPYRR